MEKSEISSISFDRELADATRKAMAEVLLHKDKFVKAFLAETGLHPSQCVMYYQTSIDGTTKIWFEKKGDKS